MKWKVTYEILTNMGFVTESQSFTSKLAADKFAEMLQSHPGYQWHDTELVKK